MILAVGVCLIIMLYAYECLSITWDLIGGPTCPPCRVSTAAQQGPLFPVEVSRRITKK